MSGEAMAEMRDIIEVSPDALRFAGERMIVLSGTAGIGSRYIHAYREGEPSVRGGVRHDQARIVGRLHPTVALAF